MLLSLVQALVVTVVCPKPAANQLIVLFTVVTNSSYNGSNITVAATAPVSGSWQPSAIEDDCNQ